MKFDILEAIAINSIFGIDEVYRCYEIFKSYDLLVFGCEFSARHGSINLEAACIKISKQKRNLLFEKVQ